MLLLTSHPFRIQYGASDDRLHDFYIPSLERSVHYDRSTGFFSSSALAIAVAGINRFIRNQGHMRLLCGAQLSTEDVEAIRQGSLDLYHAVDRNMGDALELPDEGALRDRLESLSWMISHGLLEIRVVLPVGRDGHPLAADDSREYYHPKEGYFTDAEGNRVGFSGSSNESANGWMYNYEVFTVYTSWTRIVDGEEIAGGRPYIRGIARRFEELWKGENPDWIAMDVPEAVRQKLLSICPDSPADLDPLERPVQELLEKSSKDEVQRERVLFRFLKEAPHLPNAGSLGMESCTISPWPHQRVTAGELIEQFPRSYMICDEVGLGKTIEAGLVLRQLILSGRIRRALLLVPKAVARQWQEELYEKFILNIPRYEGGMVIDVFGKSLEYTGEIGPWNNFDFLIASSHLARRRDRQSELLAADEWDLLIVDEAHHARRKDFLADQYRPNRLLELLAGAGDRPGIRGKTRCIYLLTATPMQVDPREVWDLMKVIGLGGKWGASENNFMRFFSQLRLPYADRDWDFLLNMVRDYQETGGVLDDTFTAIAQDHVDIVDWKRIMGLPSSHNRHSIMAQFDEKAKACLDRFVAVQTPVHSIVKRSTRNLLRKYREKGILMEQVPTRCPEPVWITLKPGPENEQDLYERIEEYISDFYRKYEAKRTGKGFIMTVYRRRLTSSFHALRMSLERRLKFLRGQLGVSHLLTDEDDPEQDDRMLDVVSGDEEREPDLVKQELHYVEDFVQQLSRLSGDSKLEILHQDLRELLALRDKVILFTQYTDTMDYIREELLGVYGSQIACYSGRGGETWNGLTWQLESKEKIKNEFKAGDHLRILLCTEAASEGLNLQTCGVLINYDMPWNPMRVEQRIGRIDRIGQIHEDVWIRNYFIERTVEAVVYKRLDDRIHWFEDVVGVLQPILQRVARTIETAAMTGRDQRTQFLEKEIASIREQLETRSADAFDLDSWVDDSVKGLRPSSAPASLADLERMLTTSELTKAYFQPHPLVKSSYQLSMGSDTYLVTFDPKVFDEHPYTMRFLTWGEPLLNELLARVAAEGHVSPPEGIAQLASDATGLEAFFSPGTAGIFEIHTLETMKAVLSDDLSWSDTSMRLAMEFFRSAEAKILEMDEAVQTSIQAGALLMLKEEALNLLMEAAWLKYAEMDLLDGEDRSPTLSLAIDNLVNNGYPWRGLRALVGQELNWQSMDISSDSMVVSMGSSRERRFRALTEQAEILLRECSLQSRETALVRGRSKSGPACKYLLFNVI